MIPLHTLKKLPRPQLLRKAAKLLDAEDARLAARPGFEPYSPRDGYFAELALALADDGDFPPEAAEAVKSAARELAESYAGGKPVPRRAVNELRHLVNQAVGKQTADWDLVGEGGTLSPAGRTVFPGVRVYLEDLRSPFNVGSIFRAAESFGVERMLLSPLCASPDHPRAARSSMGCTDSVPWERSRLEDAAGPVFALETGGTGLDEFDFPREGTLVLGSEELGVSPAALAAAERSLGRVSIATFGAKGSLNVAVAFGIAMREWCSRLI